MEIYEIYYSYMLYILIFIDLYGFVLLLVGQIISIMIMRHCLSLLHFPVCIVVIIMVVVMMMNMNDQKAHRG